MRIRRLQPGDDRSAFRCGDADYDDFLHKYAGQNQYRHHIGMTIVAVEDERVIGYATIAPAHVEVGELPEEITRGLPRYPLPVLRLARLAVDVRAQGIGLGTELVFEVLSVAERMRDELGCVAVIADVIETRIPFYHRLGFKRLVAMRGRPRVAGTVPLYLGVRKIAKARGSRKE